MRLAGDWTCALSREERAAIVELSETESEDSRRTTAESYNGSVEVCRVVTNYLSPLKAAFTGLETASTATPASAAMIAIIMKKSLLPMPDQWLPR